MRLGEGEHSVTQAERAGFRRRPGGRWVVGLLAPPAVRHPAWPCLEDSHWGGGGGAVEAPRQPERLGPALGGPEAAAQQTGDSG